MIICKAGIGIVRFVDQCFTFGRIFHVADGVDLIHNGDRRFFVGQSLEDILREDLLLIVRKRVVCVACGGDLLSEIVRIFGLADFVYLINYFIDRIVIVVRLCQSGDLVRVNKFSLRVV